jgi:hypothetical protein
MRLRARAWSHDASIDVMQEVPMKWALLHRAKNARRNIAACVTACATLAPCRA